MTCIQEQKENSGSVLHAVQTTVRHQLKVTDQSSTFLIKALRIEAETLLHMHVGVLCCFLFVLSHDRHVPLRDQFMVVEYIHEHNGTTY